MRYVLICFLSIISLLTHLQGVTNDRETKIAFVTLVIGQEYQKSVALGTLTKESYCKKHGYDYFCGTEILDPTRPISWSKILYLLDIMEKNPQYEWLFWSDADSLIMDSGRRLEDFIDENFNFILSEELDRFNAGHFFIKNCDWSRNFFRQIYTHTECIHHPWFEQLAAIYEILQNPEWGSQIKILPQRALDAWCIEYWNMPASAYREGDFLIHFAGVRDPNKLKALFSKYFKQSDYYKRASKQTQSVKIERPAIVGRPLGTTLKMPDLSG